MFRGNISHSFSGSKSKPCKKSASVWWLLLAGLLIGLVFDPEDGGDMFLQNVGFPSELQGAATQKMVYLFSVFHNSEQ
jgi:hypothetical protein